MKSERRTTKEIREEKLNGLAKKLALQLLKQSQENETCTCEACQNPTPVQHWTGYNFDRQNGKAGPSWTKWLLQLLPTEISAAFHSSKRPIIDFGVSTGDQHAESVRAGRTVIGYDNSSLAISTLAKIGIVGRDVDLSSLANKKLTYRDTLKADLISASDIFMVHILEYLPREAAICFIYALMKMAKSGSTFYIQSYTLSAKTNGHVDFVTVNRYGYFASFFGARTDMKLLHHQKIKKSSEWLDCVVVRKVI